MNQQNHLRGLVAVCTGTALLLAAMAAQAESWEVILPNPVAAPEGVGQDVLIDPFRPSPAAGILLATEKPNLQSKQATIVRLTPTDAASTAFTMEALDAGLLRVLRLSYKQGDGLYAVGFGTVSKRGVVTKVWKTRWSKEADQGNAGTWQDNDSFLFASKTANYDSSAVAIAADPDHNVYVCGYAHDGTVNRWIIRRKGPNGRWATVYSAASQDTYSQPYGICFLPQTGNNPAAAIFVVGIFNDQWTVLRSRDQGVNWEPVGPWPADGSLAQAWDVVGDNQGNLYVVGVRGRDGMNRGWVVRRSSDGGSQWEDLLDQPSESDSWAVRVAVDGANNVTVAGAIDNASHAPRWAVVRNRAGQSWADSWAARTFPFGVDTPWDSRGRGMVSDAAGNLFLTGRVYNWTDSDDGRSYGGSRVALLRMVP